MTDPKITTVQHIYEAFGRGDIGFILDNAISSANAILVTN